MRVGTAWDLVGETPLIKIKTLSEKTGCHIYGKAEFLNPGGSVKDRAAKSIIETAEKNGQLKPGHGIVEGTAGNTGIGLALLGVSRGYKLVITMPNNQAREKILMLKALGAEVIEVPPVPFTNENHFYHQARKYAEANPNFFWANQFENLANFEAHLKTTGPEIYRQCQNKLDIFVTSVGTGGTMSGVSSYLKSQNKNIKVVMADPMGSGLYEHFKTGQMKAEGNSITEGIGIMRITTNYTKAQIDEAMRITDQEMIDMLYYLCHYEGLVVGTSAALNVMAAYKLAQAEKNSGKTIVTILCDHGSRYQSKIFNDEWLKEKALIPQEIP